jgi:hypothetical protein
VNAGTKRRNGETAKRRKTAIADSPVRRFAGSLGRGLARVGNPCYGALICLLLACCGCGYSQSNKYDQPTSGGYNWHSLYRQDIQSVAVPIFTNKSFFQGAEFSLTKAVVNHIEANTPYKVVNRERADTILEGEIVSVQKSTVSRDRRTALPQDQLMTITVNFLWKDLRSGKILVQRKTFDQASTYYPTLGEGEFDGSQQAVEKLAIAIVQELQADW